MSQEGNCPSRVLHAFGWRSVTLAHPTQGAIHFLPQQDEKKPYKDRYAAEMKAGLLMCIEEASIGSQKGRQ